MTIKESLTHPFQIMSPTPSMNSNRHIQKYPNTNHTNGKAKIWSKKRAKEESSLEILPEHRRKRIKKMVGKFLYYGRAVDTRLLVALGSIKLEQAKGTTQTEDVVHQFSYHCETHSNEKLRYHVR